MVSHDCAKTSSAKRIGKQVLVRGNCTAVCLIQYTCMHNTEVGVYSFISNYMNNIIALPSPAVTIIIIIIIFINTPQAKHAMKITKFISGLASEA